MKYEYLKGSEKDFEGMDDGLDGVFTIYRRIGFLSTLKSNFPSNALISDIEIIAERRPITDEADLNECIGQPTETDSVESIIAERGKRYGKFSDGAEIMRDLKSVMHSTDGWERLSNSQQEALDMIQHKIGRVLNGDPNYDDNWKDIAGYATLVADEILESAKRAIELEGK